MKHWLQIESPGSLFIAGGGIEEIDFADPSAPWSRFPNKLQK